MRPKVRKPGLRPALSMGQSDFIFSGNRFIRGSSGRGRHRGGKGSSFHRVGLEFEGVN
jgi:hypothetical protein